MIDGVDNTNDGAQCGRICDVQRRCIHVRNSNAADTMRTCFAQIAGLEVCDIAQVEFEVAEVEEE